MKKLIITAAMIGLISTAAIAGGEECKRLFEDRFDKTVSDVVLCNGNLFSPDVYVIEYYGTDGKEFRQCIVGGGYVRIPSAFQKWEC